MEDGVLSGSSLTWFVDLYHANHVHDGLPTMGKDTMTFTVPVAGGHTETDIFYRVSLVAKDSRGSLDTAYVDLSPEIINVTVNSEPSGLKFTLEGSPYSTPYTFKTVKGIRRTLGSYHPQYVEGFLYLFDKWDQVADSVMYIEPTQEENHTVYYQRAQLTSLSSVDNEGTFKIYPNPFSESLTVQATKPGKFILFDMLGNVITTSAIVEGENQLKLELKSGIYHMIYQEGQKQSHIKLHRK